MTWGIHTFIKICNLGVVSEINLTMAEDKAEAKVDLGLLEEDDEFEEFPADEVSKEGDEDKDVNVWEDNWDDDKVEDDFATQLR